MREFSKGDRVSAIANDWPIIKGDEGTVLETTCGHDIRKQFCTISWDVSRDPMYTGIYGGVEHKNIWNVCSENLLHRGTVKWVSNLSNTTISYLDPNTQNTTITYPETSGKKLTLKKQSFMNKVSNFAKKLISPELTKLIEAGLIDACSLQLTDNGKTRLLEIIFQNEENKKALVAVAEEIIEDSKEK